MTTASAEPALPARAFRHVIARHPVGAMSLLMFVIAWTFLIPAGLAGVPLIPFPLLGAIFLGQLGPPVLVTWASGGWPEVRHLFGRIFPVARSVRLVSGRLARDPDRELALDSGRIRRWGGARAVHKPSVIEGYLSTAEPDNSQRPGGAGERRSRG